MRVPLGDLVCFELARLLRLGWLWVVAGVVVSLSWFEAIVGRNVPGLGLLAGPFLAVSLAAWGLQQDRSGGGLDVLLNRGVDLGELVLVRFALAVALTVAVQVVVLAPALLLGVLKPAQGVASLASVALWAALGATLGLAISHHALAILAFVLVVGNIMWFFELAPRWLQRPPIEGLWKAVSLGLHLASPLPLEESPLGRVVSPWWELVRLAAAGLLLAAGHWRWRRSCVPWQMEG